MKNQKTKKTRVLRQTISAFLVAFPVTIVTFPVTQALADPAGSAGAIKAVGDAPYEPTAQAADAQAAPVPTGNQDGEPVATPETDALIAPVKPKAIAQPPKAPANANEGKTKEPNIVVSIIAGLAGRGKAFMQGLAPDAEAKPWFQAGGIIGAVLAGLTVLFDSSATVVTAITKLFGPSLGKFLTFGGATNGFALTASGLLGGALFLGGLYLGLRAVLNAIFLPEGGK